MSINNQHVFINLHYRTKEPEEVNEIYELQNIERTVFDDEATVDNMNSKVEQMSDDIKKSTTVETRAIYLCRRGALLRKVCIVYTCIRISFTYILTYMPLSLLQLGRFIDAKNDIEK